MTRIDRLPDGGRSGASQSSARCRQHRIWYAMALLSCVLLGCQSARNEDYTPAQEGARRALVAVLDQWKEGREPGPIAGKPVVQPADTHRQVGQKLVAYDIIGELPLDHGRRYQVKLQLSNPDVEQKVQYIVVGKDPLWVYRQEDYDKLAHWDMQMPEPADTPPVKQESP